MLTQTRQIPLELLERLLNEPMSVGMERELKALASDEPTYLVPISADGKSVLIDGFGLVPLDYESVTGPSIIPSEMGLMPARLSAENGAKFILSGEFYETIRCACPQCWGEDEPDPECEFCAGQGEFDTRVQVTWDTIKDIYAKAFDRMAARPQKLDINVERERFETWFRKQYRMPESVEFSWEADGIQKMLEGWIAHGKVTGATVQ
jgi:hypothetical protein